MKLKNNKDIIGLKEVEKLMIKNLPNQAFIYLTDILNNDPQNINALNFTGIALMMTGQYKKAFDVFDKVLKIDPKNKIANYNKNKRLIYQKWFHDQKLPGGNTVDLVVYASVGIQMNYNSRKHISDFIYPHSCPEQHNFLPYLLMDASIRDGLDDCRNFHSWKDAIFGCDFCSEQAEIKHRINSQLQLLIKKIDEEEQEQAKKEIWESYISIENKIRSMHKYNMWRNDVLKKFDGKCAISNSECSGVIEVDHYPQSLYSIVRKNGIKNEIQAYECSELWDTNNGNVLCKFHHSKTSSSIYRNSKQ